MAKKNIKMLIYGEPGVGKSVFAVQSDKPFFLTTDGNYEWLEDFGGKPEDHHRVDSWADFVDFVDKNDFKGYNTIVVDLLEDLFKWNEYEFVQKNKLDHVSDAGYGKGYDITRNGFFIELTKLLNRDKNVILIMHESVITTKDRRGVEKHSYKPSGRLPDKVLDMVEGRLRFVLRAYFQDEDVEGRLEQVRMLSLIPKSNEYGIIRGVNTNALPEDLPLSYDAFVQALADYRVEFNKEHGIKTVKPKVKKEEAPDDTEEPVAVVEKPKRRSRGSSKAVDTETEIVEETKETVVEPVKHTKVQEEKDEVVEVTEPVKKETTKPTETVIENKADKMAAIKAKLAELKAKK